MEREKVLNALRCHAGCEQGFDCDTCDYIGNGDCSELLARDALALLKEQDSLLGIKQTKDGITFISTGTAHQGEERGILLGKSLMHEWIFKELLRNGLLTDDIRSVFKQAKRI